MAFELDRASVVEANFLRRLQQRDFPGDFYQCGTQAARLPFALFEQLFESQLLSRLLDLEARRLKEKGLAYYTIGSSGHEGNAALAACARADDMAFLHYRSCAFFLQRSKSFDQVDAVADILRSLVASAQDPIANGRHKVFGSAAMQIPPQTSTIASHLPKAVGAAFSIRLAKELAIAHPLADDGVIICSFGDASVNHSSAQGAFNTAQWITHARYPLPLVLVCEDNGLGISVPTPTDWIASRFEHSHFHYLQANALFLPDVYQTAKRAFAIAREKKQPVFLHLKLVRLLGHAGSDVEMHYRDPKQITADEAKDPLLYSAALAVAQKWYSPEQIIAQYQQLKYRVTQTAEEILSEPKLASADEIMASILPSKLLRYPSLPQQAKRQAFFGKEYSRLSQPRTLCQLINYALTDLLLQYPNAVIFGEDVGKKGGVYRVTAQLQKRFGPRRVFDTLLDEQTILGHAIGLAHNGFLPIPEIQFLAYYFNAEDQIRGEAATLSFFSAGQFTNPMVIRIAGLAYQKGFGGHFHNDNSLAALRDIPGVIIACPSRGADAVGLLRTCLRLAYSEQRIVFFIEPIALYATKDLHQAGDRQWLDVYPELDYQLPLGEVGIYGDVADIVILTYGNGCYLACQAQAILAAQYQIAVKVVDLRWLHPLPKEAILAQVKEARQVLIVDECRRSGSLSEALITLLYEYKQFHLQIERITAKDSFIPLGSAWQHVLPSREDIILAVRNLSAKKD